MIKLKWEENHGREQMRSKDDEPFEWWSAQWFVVGCHVHNVGGRWKFKITGVRVIEPDRSYGSKEDAFSAVEAVIERHCKSALTG